MKQVKEAIQQAEGKKYEHSVDQSAVMRKVKHAYYFMYICQLEGEIIKNKRLKETYGFGMNVEYYNALKHYYPTQIDRFEKKHAEKIHHRTTDFLISKGLQNSNYWHKMEYKTEQMFLYLLEICNYDVLAVFLKIK